ncbi:hypothetical protein BV22DRAFT_1047121 [Leucogyrophana mollusca]|uniref:Uncharacterized protein n=1 Tax=Leucogyrophana mollusca TaxID=85980 RepID=A0ACB8BHZ8_9AGAM|nr:hypothetical protein BV22DRAFT_1047121 [Leucogyrophana mollusca]
MEVSQLQPVAVKLVTRIAKVHVTHSIRRCAQQELLESEESTDDDESESKDGGKCKGKVGGGKGKDEEIMIRVLEEIRELEAKLGEVPVWERRVRELEGAQTWEDKAQRRSEASEMRDNPNAPLRIGWLG